MTLHDELEETENDMVYKANSELKFSQQITVTACYKRHRPQWTSVRAGKIQQAVECPQSDSLVRFMANALTKNKDKEEN